MFYLHYRYGQLSSFSNTVNRFADKFGVDALTVVQKTAIDIHKGLIEGTPRDTGRAASSWNLTKNEISLEVVPERESYADATPLVRADISVLDMRKGSVTFYISNNLSYIVPLSRGHSGQAPDGWIERVIDNYQRYLIQQLGGGG